VVTGAVSIGSRAGMTPRLRSGNLCRVGDLGKSPDDYRPEPSWRAVALAAAAVAVALFILALIILAVW
jgi:hypothetical protein